MINRFNTENIGYAPCKGCEARHVGCQSECGKYKKFREIVDRNNKARKDYARMYYQTTRYGDGRYD